MYVVVQKQRVIDRRNLQKKILNILDWFILIVWYIKWFTYRPSSDLLKPIFCRELKPVSDIFVVTILQAWCAQHCDLLANCVADLLTSRCPTASPSKRKRGQGDKFVSIYCNKYYLIVFTMLKLFSHNRSRIGFT